MKKTGFTLLEVIIALTIFGILAAIITPQFIKPLDNYEINTTVEEVRSLISLAQQYSISLDREVIVSF